MIDVGANRGQYLGFLRQDVGYTGRVVCFEPVSHCYVELSATAAGDGLVEVRRRALGAAPGQATIHVSHASDLSSFLRPSSLGGQIFEAGFQEAGEEVVEVSTLDGEFPGPGYARSAFLKLDTQGFDLDVLSGGAAMLERVSVLQLEVSQLALYERMPTLEESVAAVRGRGFDIIGFFPVVAADGLRAIEFDLLACRP